MSDTIAELIAGRFGLPTTTGKDEQADGAVATLLGHRTIRRYTDAAIDEATLELLFACGLSAPSKSDLQQASIVRVQAAGQRQAIAALIPDMPWIASAPVFLVVCGDSRRIRRIAEQRGHAFANDHFDAVVNAISDAAMVLQNLVTAAEALGLGACPISVVRNHAARIIELLELPAQVFPLAGLCLGHPAHPGYVSMRLPPAVTVHVDRYDDSDLAAQVDAYDRRRAAVYAIPPEKQREPERFGPAGFYGWSEDKARQTANPERADLGATLRGRGLSFD